MLLVLIRGTPLYSLLLPASTLSSLPLPYLLWSRGNASSSHLRYAPSLSVSVLLHPPLRSLYPIYYGVEGVLLYPYLEGG